MAACILRSGLYGCFSSRSSLTQRANATVSPAPRVQLFAPVTLPSCSITGGLSYCSSMLRPVPTRSRGALVVVANNKKSLGCTKQGTRRARRRTSGFRTRMASPTGRKVLKLRRKKGRKMLCPASQRSSAGKKQ